MDKDTQGQTNVNGEYYNVFDNYCDGRQPFKAVLDIGLVRTTTGNRVFGAMKGAVDGGLNIPHNTKRFPGASKGADKGETYDAEKHRSRIFGCHVDTYMKSLKTDSKEDFERQFSDWSKCLTAAKVQTVEALYKKVHAEIRKNPTHTKKATKAKPVREHKKYRALRQNAQ
jgi:large subunit ribosomal protein L5e